LKLISPGDLRVGPYSTLFTRRRTRAVGAVARNQSRASEQFDRSSRPAGLSRACGAPFSSCASSARAKASCGPTTSAVTGAGGAVPRVAHPIRERYAFASDGKSNRITRSIGLPYPYLGSTGWLPALSPKYGKRLKSSPRTTRPVATRRRGASDPSAIGASGSGIARKEARDSDRRADGSELWKRCTESAGTAAVMKDAGVAVGDLWRSRRWSSRRWR